MKIGLRFFLSWLLSSLVMFTLFYLWHGVFLNDFKRLQFPLLWFQLFAAFTYLLFGVGLYFMFESSFFRKVKNLPLRAVFCGTALGFTIFMAASIVNISLTRHLSPQHLMIDAVWQMVEQIVGAMVVVLLKVLIHDTHPEHV
ncbi:MAG TPA: hypothetical protein PLQ93_03605 [Bacteroidia bacterium]|nr:hypothetical protein [Bacteroidia bacterium]